MGIQINGNNDTISALDGSWTSDSATHFTGKVSIGGTLTYEDVTNIDSVGIITARNGIIDSTLTAGRVVYVDSDKSLTDSANLTFNGNNVTLEEGRLFVKRSTIPSVDVRNSTNTSYSRVILQQGAAEGGYFQISREGTNSTANAGANSVELNQSSNHPLTIKTNNTERLRITGDGKMGLGTGNNDPVGGDFVIENTTGLAGVALSRVFSGNVASSAVNTPSFAFTMSDTATNDQVVASISPQALAGTGDAFKGHIRVFTANDAGTNTERIRITSDGAIQSHYNPSLPVTDSRPILQLGYGVVGDDSAGRNNVSTNAYPVNGNATWHYIGSSSLAASRYDCGFGEHKWFTAAAGTRGNDITWSEKLKIDSSGRILVNGAADGWAFAGGNSLIIGNTTSGTRTGMTLVSHSGQDSGVYFSRGGSSNSEYVKGQLVYNHPNDYFAIYTGGTGIRLKISEKGGHNVYNDEGYYAATLAECNDDKLALNIRKTRNAQTKGIALGSIGSSSSHTGIQAYDTSDNSANELSLNPFGGALLVGLTSPTYGSGDMQHEIKKNNSRTYTAPLMAAHSHLLLNNSDTTAGVFCGIGMRAGTGDGAIGFHYRGATNQSDFVIATDSGANGVEGFRIKSQTRTCSIGDNIDPLNALHILDRTTSSWDAALTAGRAALRVETHYSAQGERAVGDYGGGIVFNHLAGHSSLHNNDSHAWLGLRVHDTPGYERSCLVFATNDITGSESGHDAGLKERMQINPHGQVAINYSGTMISNSHARLWVETPGNNLATEWDPGDNQGTLPHVTLAGQNSHVRLDIGTMDTNPFAGYIQARYDNSPDLGSTDSADGLEPLQIQPRGGQTYFNFGHSTTYPANFSPTSDKGGIKIRAGTADSASVSDANTAIKIWPAAERQYSSGRMGDADQGSKYGGIAWLLMDGQSPGKSGWAAYDGNQCWMGMSIHSTPGQELGNWQLRMNDSGNQNSVANKIALQASPQGWVTKPNQPMFLAHKNSGNRITGTGYVVFGDQIEEVGGDNYNNSDGKFTAPIGGYYYIWSSINAYKRIDFHIRINGSTDHTHRQIGQFNTANQDGWYTHTVHRIFRMEKDEYAQVYVSSLNQNTDPGEWCTFGGYLIG